jgi:hypothetical protein
MVPAVHDILLLLIYPVMRHMPQMNREIRKQKPGKIPTHIRNTLPGELTTNPV